MSKTDKAVKLLVMGIKSYLNQHPYAKSCIIKELQFDVFGFSRGAATARHFANRVFNQDPAIIAAIKMGLEGVEFSGTAGGKTRFLGIFDTVAAIGTLTNGYSPHSADTGNVNIVLRPGVAEKVFHITAQHECRFNFALNSVKPAWPELELPGSHSDIGGGYNPEEYEACYLTRPWSVTVPFCTPETETDIYQRVSRKREEMATYPAIAPMLRAGKTELYTWHDDRMPADRHGALQKRSGAALILERQIYNDWSKVVLRVMIDAAQEGGVIFDPIRQTNKELSFQSDLNSLCEKAILMGRAIRRGQPCIGFSSSEIETLAREYLHCSAHWNYVKRDSQGEICNEVAPLETLYFTNRPDVRWRRTIYNMDGNRIWTSFA